MSVQSLLDAFTYIYIILYTLVNKNKKGLAMAHLAVQCHGSESDFEETVKVINTIGYYLSISIIIFW